MRGDVLGSKQCPRGYLSANDRTIASGQSPGLDARLPPGMTNKKQSEKVYDAHAHYLRDEMGLFVVAAHPRKDFGAPANLSNPRGLPHKEQPLSA